MREIENVCVVSESVEGAVAKVAEWGVLCAAVIRSIHYCMYVHLKSLYRASLVACGRSLNWTN